MGKLIIMAALIASLLYGCKEQSNNKYGHVPAPQKIEQPVAPQGESQAKPANVTLDDKVNTSSPETITLASFNIQVFGDSKAAKEDVMKALTDIVIQYDIIAIQEVRDSS